VSKIDLDTITSGYNLSKINANFQRVEDELNNRVLYKDSPVGEPNSMSSNLDMNRRSILNASKISSNVLELGGVQVVPTDLAIDPYNGTREALRRSYAEAGYHLVGGSFEAGGTLVNVNDALLHESSGLAYKWGGAFQKVVPPNSTPATTGGVYSAGWLSLGDITLRDEVQQRLDTADANTAAFKANNGFNLVGRLLNLTTLKSALPTTAGDIVFVTSAASTTASEKHYGGGFFQAFDNSSSPISDDGGVHIIPTTGTLGWKRINFTELDMTFWGVKPDSGIDNSAEIMKAMSYVRTKKTTIRFPAGVVTSTQALPIWSECAIVGHGREVSQFVKTTNNGWPVASGVNIDALCVCLPDVYNPSGYTMDAFCIRPRIKGISLRRSSVTLANRSAYGIWGHKLAQSHFSDMLVLGGNYGFYSINCFLMIQEQVSYSGVVGSYAGVYVANTLTGSYGRSGTTCNFTQVGVGGYNFGFFIAGLDSTRLTQCDVEAISRVSGEAQCVGYAWINPMNCTMANCYTEDVDGPQLTVGNANTISIANSLVVDNFNMTPPNKAFTQPTPLMTVDAAGLGSLKVTFVGGDLRFAVAGTNNMMPPTAQGANCKVTILGGFTNPWSTSAGGVVTEL
jgi:hypothetical protein